MTLLLKIFPTSTHTVRLIGRIRYMYSSLRYFLTMLLPERFPPIIVRFYNITSYNIVFLSCQVAVVFLASPASMGFRAVRAREVCPEGMNRVCPVREDWTDARENKGWTVCQDCPDRAVKTDCQVSLLGCIVIGCINLPGFSWAI